MHHGQLFADDGVMRTGARKQVRYREGCEGVSSKEPTARYEIKNSQNDEKYHLYS